MEWDSSLTHLRFGFVIPGDLWEEGRQESGESEEGGGEKKGGV